MFHHDVCSLNVILLLHYVPDGHGDHVSDNREQNGINVRQRRGTGYVNVAGRDSRGHRGEMFDILYCVYLSHFRHFCRGRLLNSEKNCHGVHGYPGVLRLPIPFPCVASRLSRLITVV